MKVNSQHVRRIQSKIKEICFIFVFCLLLISIVLERDGQAFARGIKPPVPTNGCYIGMFLGGTAASNREAMADFNAKSGKRHAVFHRFVEVNTGEDWTNQAEYSIEQFMRACAAVGATPMLTLEPVNKLEDDGDGLKTGDRAWLEMISKHVGQYALPTFIRFAHEMNLKGDDNKWRGNLSNDLFFVAYRRAFKTTAEIFHEQAPNAAMVWCVNQIWGQLPFTPFYPGDEYVDWVAMDFYHRLNNSNVADYKFFNFFNIGISDAPNVKEPGGSDFYTTFSDPNNPVGHKKPMMLAETAASNQPSTKPGTINPGQNWWIDAVYDVPNLIKKYPNMKAIVWFGEDKQPDPNVLEIWEEPWAIRDFAHYSAAIADSYFLSAPIVDEFGRLVTTLGEFKQAALLQNFPNPFNPDTWIPYRLAETTPVRIAIYDVAGYLVRTLNFGTQAPGDYITRQTAAYWDGKNENGDGVASGIYFYQLSAGNFRASKKMLLLK